MPFSSHMPRLPPFIIFEQHQAYQLRTMLTSSCPRDLHVAVLQGNALMRLLHPMCLSVHSHRRAMCLP